jgi:multimeric flavodoxin WrbA
MQVTVTITNGKVTNSSVAHTGPYNIGFNSNGCTEAVFNSAAIDLSADSGANARYVALKPRACTSATYSWKGYGNSLQSAIDKATY